jgi:hypothetical protein
MGVIKIKGKLLQFPLKYHTKQNIKAMDKKSFLLFETMLSIAYSSIVAIVVAMRYTYQPQQALTKKQVVVRGRVDTETSMLLG